MTEYQRQLYAWLAGIPRGRVVTYGQLAALIGRPRGARWVGAQLRALPADTALPWHRVVNASGRSSLPLQHDGSNHQLRRLAAEGVEIVNGCISLSRYGWRIPAADAGMPDRISGGNVASP